MTELQKLPNIGKMAEELLVKAGIDTAGKLRSVGSKEAFLRIRLQDPGACLHMLYGLEGAVRGIRDADLSQQAKQELKNFFRTL